MQKSRTQQISPRSHKGAVADRPARTRRVHGAPVDDAQEPGCGSCEQRVAVEQHLHLLGSDATRQGGCLQKEKEKKKEEEWDEGIYPLQEG